MSLFSPESPLYRGNPSEFERIDKMFKISSKARANYIASMSKSNAYAELENITPFECIKMTTFSLSQYLLDQLGTNTWFLTLVGF